MKTILALLIMAVMPFSCTTFKPINKAGTPVTADIRSKLKKDKKHLIKLKTGKTLIVFVQGWDEEKLYGEGLERDNSGKLVRYPFEEKFADLEKHAQKVSVRKVSVVLTTVTVAVSVLFIGELLRNAIPYSFSFGK